MGKNIAKVSTTFQTCDGGSCRKAHSEIALREARAYLRNADLWDTTHTIRTRCNGRCEDAPTWIVQPGNYWYKNVTAEKAVDIVKSHIDEDKPIDDYLLYKDDWDTMVSDNERPVKPHVFKAKNDTEYGEVLSVRAPASDQYIYPLFKTLFNAPEGLNVALQDKEEVLITTQHTVDYTDDFDILVKGSETTFVLAIGPITKAIEAKVSQEVKDRKISVAEVIWDEKHTDYRGYIRFKNNKGKHLLTLRIPVNEKNSWTYILKIYLHIDINTLKIKAPLDN